MKHLILVKALPISGFTSFAQSQKKIKGNVESLHRFPQIIILLMFLFSCPIKAHINEGGKKVVSTEYLGIKTTTLSVAKYKPSKRIRPDLKRIFLDVNFGDYIINNKGAVDSLKGMIITSISLVYTKYPVEQNLSRLNNHRFEHLKELCPTAFNNPELKCKIITQTECNDEESARKLFHGFVIMYKPAPFVPRRDSSVIEILKRNRWKDMTIVTDFTGSMGPYISQIYYWYKLTYATKDISEFVFFNDGDGKPDYKKQSGNTGGLYYCKSTVKDSMFKAAYRCRNAGDGGDAQENNIEAILFAIEKNPKLKEVYMMADNNADMRDYDLMSKVKIPVHIILCGVDEKTPINTEYLDLARNTNGSIHTVEEDIDNLIKIAEGKTIEIGGFEYKITNGKFVQVKRT